MRVKKAGAIFLLFLLTELCAQAQVTGSVQVATSAPNNKRVTVYYRVPKGYDAQRRDAYRVLMIFGGRNTTGRADVSGRLGWGKWADQHGVFLVCPGFTDDNYWEPNRWSGRALSEALSLIGRTYKICPSKLFFYGYSAGSQGANLFPAWRPDLTRAWVSHACGYFYTPSTVMRGVPGLVTCGDADTMRYMISRRFVEDNHRFGVDVIWRSYPNHPHDVPPDSLALARAFLTFYHTKYAMDLRYSHMAGRAEVEEPEFIGDAEDYEVYPVGSPGANNILPEDRVALPSKEVAEAWRKKN